MNSIENSKDSVYNQYNVQPGIIARNLRDADDNPTGGDVKGKGLEIKWQEGARSKDGEALADSNGAFVEDVIWTALQRLQFFQESKYKTRENALAITHLEKSLFWLNHRRLQRAARGIEGRYEV